MRKKRVLFVVNIPSPYRVAFFNNLSDFCDLTVCFEGKNATDRDTKWKSDETIRYEQIVLKGMRVRSDAFVSLGVISVLKKRWDVIILGGYSTPTLAIAAEYLIRKRIKYWLEVDGGFIANDSRMKYSIKRHFIQNADRWLSTGRITTEYLIHYGAKEEKCYLYPFSSIKKKDILAFPYCFDEGIPIDVRRNKYEADRHNLRMKAKLKVGISEDFVVLAVGQFIHRKGFDVLIKACKHFNSEIGVYIVGGEPTADYLALAKETGFSNIHFVEFKSKKELEPYYITANVFVHPTREDIWGLVVNEALAYGIPVVTTDKCNAGLEMIDPGKTGKIIEVDSPLEISQAVNDIISGRYFGLDCILTAEKYTIEKMTERHYELFTS